MFWLLKFSNPYNLFLTKIWVNVVNLQIYNQVVFLYSDYMMVAALVQNSGSTREYAYLALLLSVQAASFYCNYTLRRVQLALYANHQDPGPLPT